MTYFCTSLATADFDTPTAAAICDRDMTRASRVTRTLRRSATKSDRAASDASSSVSAMRAARSAFGVIGQAVPRVGLDQLASGACLPVGLGLVDPAGVGGNSLDAGQSLLLLRCEVHGSIVHPPRTGVKGAM